MSLSIEERIELARAMGLEITTGDSPLYRLTKDGIHRRWKEFAPDTDPVDAMAVLTWILSHRGISAGHVMPQIARFVPRFENDRAICLVAGEWRGNRIVVINEDADKAQALRSAIASCGLAVARRLSGKETT